MIIFVVSRLYLFLNMHSVVVPDSIQYLPPLQSRFSNIGLFGTHGRASILTETLYAILNQRTLVVTMQLVVSVIAWIFLATVINGRTRSVAPGIIVLIYGSLANIVMWDRLFLAESLSISLSVSLVALAVMPASQTINYRVVRLLSIAVLLVLTKAQNTFFVFSILLIWGVNHRIILSRVISRLYKLLVTSIILATLLWGFTAASKAQTFFKHYFALTQAVYNGDNSSYRQLALRTGIPTCKEFWMLTDELHNVPKNDAWDLAATKFQLVRSNFDLKCPGLIEWVQNGAVPRHKFIENPKVLFSLFLDDQILILGGVNPFSSHNEYIMALHIPIVLEPFNDLITRSGLSGMAIMFLVMSSIHRLSRKKKETEYSRGATVNLLLGLLIGVGGVILAMIAEGGEVGRHAIPYNYLLKLVVLISPWFISFEKERTA